MKIDKNKSKESIDYMNEGEKNCKIKKKTKNLSLNIITQYTMIH